MLAHQPCGSVRIARVQPGEDRLVLLDVVGLPLLLAAPLGEEPPVNVSNSEPLEELGEGVVARRPRHGCSNVISFLRPGRKQNVRRPTDTGGLIA